MDVRKRNSFRRFRALWLLALLALLLPAAPPLTAAPEQPPTLQATPEPLVNDDDVRNFTINGNALYWQTTETCTPALAANGDNQESLLRIPTYSGTSRLLYEREVDTISPGCSNGSTYRSNLAADADFVYWVRTDGRLVKLSREANPGDQPVPVLQQVFNGYPAINDLIGLAIVGEYIFVNSTLANQSTIYRVRTSDGTLATVDSLNTTASKLTAKENYVYWLSNGCAYRARLLRNGWSVVALECGGVTAIFPEGERTLCFLGCSTTNYVFLGKGKQVIRHNNLDGAETVVYTSDSSNPNVTIADIAGDGVRIFLVEYRENACNPQPCFSSSDQALYRSGRSNDNNAGLLHFATGFFGPVSVELRAAQVGRVGTYIFWLANGDVVRLPGDAEAIPVINMRITDIEVTQAIQDLDNSVMLIRDKRTFARVHVKSDGDPVEAVRATLRATWDGGGDGPISSTSPGGWLLKVQPNPDRDNIEQSFLFELPLEWTRQSNLRLYAELNPYELPPEPNYSDNQAQVGPLSFQPSPRLEVKFFAWGYELNDTVYYPRYQEDILQTFGWIRRVYPLATPAPFGSEQGGFVPDVRHIFDSELGARVDRSAEECQKLLIKNPDGTVKRTIAANAPASISAVSCGPGAAMPAIRGPTSAGPQLRPGFSPAARPATAPVHRPPEVCVAARPGTTTARSPTGTPAMNSAICLAGRIPARPPMIPPRKMSKAAAIKPPTPHTPTTAH